MHKETSHELGITNLQPKDQKTLFQFLHTIEINNGCGERPCVMCSNYSPQSNGSMELPVIKELHTLKQQHAPHVPFWHYETGDTLYYGVNLPGGVNYVEVVDDALEKRLFLSQITTHGFLPGEDFARQTALELTQYLKSRNHEPLVEFSVDPYGFIGVDEDTHRESITQSITALGPICRKITGFYNPQDEPGGDYSQQATLQLLMETIPPKYHRLITFEKIEGIGRALYLSPGIPKRKKTNFEFGYAIRKNGDVVFTPDFYSSEQENVGNIYTGIKDNLSNPVPRIPDDFG